MVIAICITAGVFIVLGLSVGVCLGMFISGRVVSKDENNGKLFEEN